VRTAWILLGAALFSLSFLRAGDELEFAVPDDGRITLGVFDGSGKLVRVLHKLAKQGDFRIGDNGLITSWDGKNDAGERVSAGHYHVRGYLIGEDVRVSGEDFFFNDWAADPGFPGFGRIKDFSLLENGDVILLAEAGANSYLLARFSPDKGFLWSCKIEPKVAPLRIPRGLESTDSALHPLSGSVLTFLPPDPNPSFPPLLAANSSLAVVIAEGRIAIHSLDDGQEKNWQSRESVVAPLALAANDSKMFISFSGGLVENALPALTPLSARMSHPPYALALDADASTLIEASSAGVLIWKDRVPVTLPTSAKSVALGMPGTFWFVGTENDAPFVGQASFNGEVLRTLRPTAGDPKPEKIRASRTAEKFAVTESLPGLQRLRLMARAKSGEWTIEWERTIRESANFGFVDGKPAADAGSVAQEKSLRFRLKENPLTGKRDFLTLRAESDPSGSRLVSPDGLPLVDISDRIDLRRTAIRRGDKPDTLRVLQGNGSFVEEFSISGLDDILPLDAGSMDIP
jgi:hypothetical protein